MGIRRTDHPPPNPHFTTSSTMPSVLILIAEGTEEMEVRVCGECISCASE